MFVYTCQYNQKELLAGTGRYYISKTWANCFCWIARDFNLENAITLSLQYEAAFDNKPQSQASTIALVCPPIHEFQP